jgi:hypothetical protein
MRIHITQTTKQFLPEKVYKSSERGMIDIPGKSSLKTFLIVGKYNKAGEIEKMEYTNIHIDEEEKNKEIAHKIQHNSKWEGFRLTKN